MKIVCNCGNEEEFNTIDKETGKQTRITDNEGQYATIKHFTFLEQRDVVGVVCDKCGRALWIFT